MDIQRPPSKQPIPPEATCVFKGKIFDVYQWEQPQYDGTTRTFEKLKRPDTVLVVAVTPEKKILISYQEQPGKPPFVGLLGGRVDEGEEVLAAAKRELREEAGVESDRWSLFFAVQPVSKIEWGVYCFVAHDCRKVGEQELDGGEKIEVKEVDFDEFLKIATDDEFTGQSFTEVELQLELLRAKQDPKRMAIIKNLILG